MSLLEHLGELVGVKKLEGKYAKTTILFRINEILTFDIPIPKGTEIETQDGKYIFITDDDVNIIAGRTSISVDAICSKTGVEANNYAIGTINNLITPLTYDIDEVSNTVISYGGAEEESADNLRERIRLAPESFSNAGSEGATRRFSRRRHPS